MGNEYKFNTLDTARVNIEKQAKEVQIAARIMNSQAHF